MKPCPFCEGETHLSDHLAGVDGMERSARSPRCSRCGVDLGYCRNATEAIVLWNRRAPDRQRDEARAEAERLAGALREAAAALEAAGKLAEGDPGLQLCAAYYYGEAAAACAAYSGDTK